MFCSRPRYVGTNGRTHQKLDELNSHLCPCLGNHQSLPYHFSSILPSTSANNLLHTTKSLPPILATDNSYPYHLDGLLPAPLPMHLLAIDKRPLITSIQFCPNICAHCILDKKKLSPLYKYDASKCSWSCRIACFV